MPLNCRRIPGTKAVDFVDVEIKAKVIDGENLEVNFPECMEVYRANLKQARPEYPAECKLEY